MLSSIQRFFETRLHAAGQPADHEHALRLAAAALLVEMTRADFTVEQSEREAVLEALRRTFPLQERELTELVALAESEASNTVSLFPFTDLINRHYGPEEKRTLIRMLWRVAAADGHLDKYEDHLVRKVAELLYVPHRDFIRCKHEVLDELGLGS